MRTLFVLILSGLFLTGCAASHSSSDRWAVTPLANGNALMLDRNTGQTWVYVNGDSWELLTRKVEQTPPPAQAESPKPVAPTTFKHVEDFDSPLLPQDVASQFVQAGQQLRFPDFGSTQGDYFNAVAGMRNFQGDETHVACTWKKDGLTTVRVESNLPDAQNAKLLELFKSSLAERAAKANSGNP
jgi:hypothetical protein